MTELVDSTDQDEMIGSMTTDIVDQKELAEQLLEQAKEQNIELVGPDGLLGQLTKNVLETALDAEMSEHLGYEKHDPAGRNSGNSRNGTRAKTVLTEIGPVEIEVPRDTESTFEPQIVRKRQRRLTGVDEIVLSLTARGLTTGEIAAHFQEVYGAQVSKDTVSRITEKVTGEMTEWLNRPLEKVYPVIFIDAMVVKVRDGQVANKPVYVVIGVTVDGERDILGLWAGDGGEGAKFWLSVFTEIKNRGVQDVCIAVCDGLKGLPEAITATWELATVQACVIHLDPQHLPVRFPQVLGRDEPGPQTRLYGTLRGSRQGALRGVRRQVGQAVSSDQQALGERLERVHTVPGLRRRDPTRDLLNKRDRVAQRPLPTRGQSPRALPQRHGRAEVPLPRDQSPRPHRARQSTLGDEMEARTERVRDSVRRKNQINQPSTSTVNLTLPGCGIVRCGAEAAVKTTMEVVMPGQLALQTGEVLVAAAVWETLPPERQREVTIQLARLLARLVEDERDE